MDTQTKLGRPTKLTPQLQETICQFIEEGNYISTACMAAGIWPTTYEDWLKRGEQEVDGEYHSFYLAIKRAEAEAEVKLVALARAHSKKTVIAPLSLLDRRFRVHWGQTPIIQIDNRKQITISEVEVIKDYGQGQVVEGEARELPTASSPLNETIKRLKAD